MDGGLRPPPASWAEKSGRAEPASIIIKSIGPMGACLCLLPLPTKQGSVGFMPLQLLEIGFHVEIHAIEWHDFEHETQFHGVVVE